jgi:hypothetical protein
MLVSSGAHDGPSTRLPRQCQAALAKYEAARLTGRGLEHHAPCVWRALPIQEWVAWLTGGYETPLEELDRRDYVCAACRQLKGLGE